MLLSFFIESKMEYKKNKKKFSLALEKEVALKAVSNKRKAYGMLKRENGQNLLVKLVTKL